MKEALGFKGKDFNYMNTTYLVVYAVCQMPGTSLLTIASPKYVFVSANVTWSVLVSSFCLVHYLVVIAGTWWPLTNFFLTDLDHFQDETCLANYYT